MPAFLEKRSIRNKNRTQIVLKTAFNLQGFFLKTSLNDNFKTILYKIGLKRMQNYVF